MRGGDVPTIHRWVNDGQHRLVGWTTGWSSQTGVSQCGILHGSTHDMPAFRWVDKSTGEIVVSNRPSVGRRDRAGPLRRQRPARPPRVELRQPVLRRRRAGRADDERDRPAQGGPLRRGLLRLLLHAAAGDAHARRHRHRGVRGNGGRRPSSAAAASSRGCPAGWTYSLLRAFTTIISRDVSVQGVINDMCEGRAAIYVDFLGYDEVSHHSGPERIDTLAVLRDLDRQIARIERAARVDAAAVQDRRAVRPRSDPGRDVRPAHRRDAWPTSSPGCAVRRRPVTRTPRRARPSRPRGCARRATPTPRSRRPRDVPIVLGSGSLGLISLPGEPRRLTREEIDERYPDADPRPARLAGDRVRARPRRATARRRCSAPAGSRNLATGEVVGDDPLAPFGPLARPPGRPGRTATRRSPT